MKSFKIAYCGISFENSIEKWISLNEQINAENLEEALLILKEKIRSTFEYFKLFHLALLP